MKRLKRLESFCKTKANKVDGVGWSTASILGVPIFVDVNAPPGKPFPLYYPIIPWVPR